jgi:hypothetical protein
LGNFGDVGPPASGGGGVIAILAGGPMQVTGTVRARGGDISFDASFFFSRPPGTGGAGSGGSILLGSLQCTRVSGTVDASGGTWMVATIASGNRGGDGFVRIDSYTACGAPDLTGASIHPAPTVALLPFLTALAPARIGQVYPVRCASAPGDVLGFYTSLATAPLQLPPFGTLELAPPIYFLGQFAVPATGADPLAIADIPIPGALALVGATLYSQMFNAFGAVTGQARLSNLLVTTIGS